MESLQQPTFSSSSSSSFSLGPPNLPEQTVTKQRQLTDKGYTVSGGLYSKSRSTALFWCHAPSTSSRNTNYPRPPSCAVSANNNKESGRNELLPRADLEQTGERPPDLAGRRILSHPRQPEPARQLRPFSKVSHDCSVHEQCVIARVTIDNVPCRFLELYNCTVIHSLCFSCKRHQARFHQQLISSRVHELCCIYSCPRTAGLQVASIMC